MISIIITTYNRSSMLKEAINSVLKQKEVEYEIIVIDDCSSDNTQDILKQYSQIKYIINKENKGPSLNRLTGFDMSKGEYIIFMDDDDYYIDEHFFSNAIKILQECDTLSFVSGNSFIKREDKNSLIKSPMNIKGYIKGQKYLDGFQYKYSKPHSTFNTIFRRSSLNKANLKQMNMINDSSIYMRALTTGDAYIINKEIGVYRIHASNISKLLDCGFIIKNLEEKFNIYNNIKNNLSKPHYWWFQQFRLTYKYYLNSSPNKDNIIQILHWGNNHSDKSIFLKLYIYYKLIFN